MPHFSPNRSDLSSHLLEVMETDLLVSMFRPKAGQRLLEVGCGSGRRLKLFRDRGLDVLGLESDQVLVDNARRSIGNDSLVRLGEPGELPFEDNTFDLVLLGHALVRAFDPRSALAEAGRVARKRIIVKTYNPYSLIGLNHRLQGKSEIDRWVSPWGLTSMARQIFGATRMQRITLLTFPKAWLKRLKTIETAPLVQQSPWGGIILLKIDLKYTVRTRPLTVPSKPVPLGPQSGPYRRQTNHRRGDPGCMQWIPPKERPHLGADAGMG